MPIEHWIGEDCLLLGIDRYYADKAQHLTSESVLQVVCPDADGYLPWDPLVDPEVRRDQPILADGDPPERRTPLPDDIDNSGACVICSGQASVSGPNRAARRAAMRQNRRKR